MKRTIPPAIPEDHAHQIADASGLFGPPEHCADRLLRAREEAGVEDVFLFPAHDLAGGYNMPEAEVEAFERMMRPRLGGSKQHNEHNEAYAARRRMPEKGGPSD